MPSLASVLKGEIRRLARKEVRTTTESMRNAVAQFRRDIAELKRENAALKKKVAFLEQRERKRLGSSVSEEAVEGTRFSTRSLKAQRRKAGLSQAEYAMLVGVSTLTMSNWELGKTRPRQEHLARLVSIRGLGKREAQKRLKLLGQ